MTDQDVTAHDTTAQAEAVTRARQVFADRLTVLAEECGADPRLAAVKRESLALVKALRSRAKRPPPVDTITWAGALSAADRHAVYPALYDSARGRAHDAEYLLDLAVYDLRTASGSDV